MSNQNNGSGESAKSWERYWDGSDSAAAFSSGGASHPLIDRFWRDFFGQAEFLDMPLRLLDVATGTGSVVGVASQVLSSLEVHCVDISRSALQAVKQRFPQTQVYCMDASALEFPDASFDIVSSQFGVEYAGKDALLDAAAKVADNGWLAMLVHTEDSGIYRECFQAGQAIRRLQAANFLPLARQMFVAAFAAHNGGDQAVYHQAAQRLMPAFRELEEVLNTYGAHVAGDTPLRLYQDVENIHQKLESYKSEEVIAWLDAMAAELDAYAGRMSSMCEAAISAPHLAEIRHLLAGQGFAFRRSEALTPEHSELSLGFVLVAQKLS